MKPFLAAAAFALAGCTLPAPPARSTQAPAPPAPTPTTTTTTTTQAPPPAPTAAEPAPVATAPAAAPTPAKEEAPAKAPVPKVAPAKTPAKSAPPATAPAPATSPAPSARPAPLDLRSLEQRLRATGAIGVLTKLSLKNQVDDLIGRFHTYHEGRRPPTIADLRPAFELLLMKVLSLLQDHDAALANDINASRDALWGVLNDREKLAQYQ